MEFYPQSKIPFVQIFFTFYLISSLKSFIEPFNLVDIPLITELKKKNAILLDAKFINGGYLALAYRDNFASNVVHIRAFESQTSALIKSADLSCYYRPMIPLSNERLIVFTTETQAELWDLKSQSHFSTQFNLDFYSHVTLLSDKCLVFAEGTGGYQHECTTYVWEIGETDLRLTRKITHASNSEIDTSWFQKVDKEKFMIFVSEGFEIWDTDAQLIRSFKIDDLGLNKIKAVGEFVVYETSVFDYFINDLQSCVLIRNFEDGKLLRKFDKYTLVGLTPYEIFICNNNADKFDIEIYALDDEFTFLGILNTQHIYHENIISIECDSVCNFLFRTILYRDDRHEDILVGIVTLNSDCGKLNFESNFGILIFAVEMKKMEI